MKQLERHGTRLLTVALCAVAMACSGGPILAKPAAGHPDDPVDVIWFPNPPYAVNRQGVPAGFEIDLWRMIAETRQIPYTIRKAESFQDLLTAIRTDQADLAISGVLINENRSKQFKFSFPTATSDLKIYKLNNDEPTALKLLRIVLSRQVLLIFLGLILIGGLFALPVWFMERNRPELQIQRRRHQLVFFLQKTLLLSTDHTRQTKTRLISIASLFARVLLTAYFTSYILNIATNESKSSRIKLAEEVNFEALKTNTFAAIPGYIQTSILESNGVETVECDVAETCIRLLQTGKAEAILDDMLTMRSALATMPPEPEVSATTEKLMTLFMAFAISDAFGKDPRAGAINDAIARSYYDGSHAKLSRSWLRE